MFVPKAEAKGRNKLTYGIRLHVIVRETNEQAWAAANELIQYLDDAAIAAAQKNLHKWTQLGQQRRRLYGSNRDKLGSIPKSLGRYRSESAAVVQVQHLSAILKPLLAYSGICGFEVSVPLFSQAIHTLKSQSVLQS